MTRYQNLYVCDMSVYVDVYLYICIYTDICMHACWVLEATRGVSTRAASVLKGHGRLLGYDKQFVQRSCLHDGGKVETGFIRVSGRV